MDGTRKKYMEHNLQNEEKHDEKLEFSTMNRVRAEEPRPLLTL